MESIYNNIYKTQMLRLPSLYKKTKETDETKSTESFVFIKNDDNYKEPIFSLNTDQICNILHDDIGQNNAFYYNESTEDDYPTNPIDDLFVNYEYDIDDNFHTRLFFASISFIGVWVVYKLYTSSSR